MHVIHVALDLVVLPPVQVLATAPRKRYVDDSARSGFCALGLVKLAAGAQDACARLPLEQRPIQTLDGLPCEGPCRTLLDGSDVSMCETRTSDFLYVNLAKVGDDRKAVRREPMWPAAEAVCHPPLYLEETTSGRKTLRDPRRQ